MPGGFYQGRRKGDLGLPGRMPNIDEMVSPNSPSIQPPRQIGTMADGSPAPVGGGDVRSLAGDAYRNAILRRMGGGGGMPAPTMQMPPTSLQGGGDSSLMDLLRTRTSRRVLRGFPGADGGTLPQ